jgi:hypothetical protein
VSWANAAGAACDRSLYRISIAAARMLTSTESLRRLGLSSSQRRTLSTETVYWRELRPVITTGAQATDKIFSGQ